MTGPSRALLVLLLGGVGLVVSLVLLALGPLGWLAAGIVAFCALIYRAVRDDPAEQTPDRTSCPDCGAPNPVDAERCGYCDAAL